MPRIWHSKINITYKQVTYNIIITIYTTNIHFHILTFTFNINTTCSSGCSACSGTITLLSTRLTLANAKNEEKKKKRVLNSIVCSWKNNNIYVCVCMFVFLYALVRLWVLWLCMLVRLWVLWLCMLVRLCACWVLWLCMLARLWFCVFLSVNACALMTARLSLCIYIYIWLSYRRSFLGPWLLVCICEGVNRVRAWLFSE